MPSPPSDGCTRTAARRSSRPPWTGSAWVQLPGHYGRDEIPSGALLPVLETWASKEPFEFFIVYPQRRLPQRVRTLIDFLVNEMRAL
ncbi:hypothetical protein [Methylobacterium sp. CM6246]